MSFRPPFCHSGEGWFAKQTVCQFMADYKMQGVQGVQSGSDGKWLDKVKQM